MNEPKKPDVGVPLLSTAVIVLLLGVWWRSAVVFSYNDPSTQDVLVGYAVDSCAYSDISALYFRD